MLLFIWSLPSFALSYPLRFTSISCKNAGTAHEKTFEEKRPWPKVDTYKKDQIFKCDWSYALPWQAETSTYFWEKGIPLCLSIELRQKMMDSKGSTCLQNKALFNAFFGFLSVQGWCHDLEQQAIWPRILKESLRSSHQGCKEIVYA